MSAYSEKVSIGGIDIVAFGYTAVRENESARSCNWKSVIHYGKIPFILNVENQRQYDHTRPCNHETLFQKCGKIQLFMALWCFFHEVAGANPYAHDTSGN
jgi:high-affinity Fe2+/Pb2+ permease